jgi:hypothetical protein
LFLSETKKAKLRYNEFKNINSELFNLCNDTKLHYDIGNMLINFATTLKLIQINVKIQSRTDKISIFIADEKLEHSLLESNKTITQLPYKIPMITIFLN